jgi:hypothetical protein
MLSWGKGQFSLKIPEKWPNPPGFLPLFYEKPYICKEE